MTVKELEGYQVVCLFEAGNPSPALWGNLKAYVEGGGGLIIVPPGDEIDTPEGRKRFNDEAAARKLLPATLEKLETVPADPGFGWLGDYDGNHPLLLPFREWSRSADPDFARPNTRPFVNRYWWRRRWSAAGWCCSPWCWTTGASARTAAGTITGTSRPSAWCWSTR
jgi:hypothetical protein